jgi:hypothetical protein
VQAPHSRHVIDLLKAHPTRLILELQKTESLRRLWCSGGCGHKSKSHRDSHVGYTMLTMRGERSNSLTAGQRAFVRDYPPFSALGNRQTAQRVRRACVCACLAALRPSTLASSSSRHRRQPCFVLVVTYYPPSRPPTTPTHGFVFEGHRTGKGQRKTLGSV